MKFKLFLKQALNALAIALIAAAMYFLAPTAMFNLAYFAAFLFASFRAIQNSGYRKRTRTFLVISYGVVLVLQIAFFMLVVLEEDTWRWSQIPVRKLFAVIALFLPAVISRYVATSKHIQTNLYLLNETGAISFSEVREFADRVTSAVAGIKEVGGRLTPRNFKEVFSDIPRHDNFRYINTGSLTEEYLKAVEETFNDPYLYLTISNTGTPASEIISVFTKRQFNHASISFDAELKTIISYNGGERVSRPGLNAEMVELFYKKDDASILVYRLKVTPEQKRLALDKIKQINEEGSAYNVLGLFIKRTHKPNILYCSEFTYKMLEVIGASYFKADRIIKPTDFIEKDYFRKLEFVEELRLNK